MSSQRSLTAVVTLSVATVVAAGPPAPGDARGAIVVSRVVYLMGTRATLAVATPDRPSGLAWTERLLRVLESAESEMSTWRGDTPLSRLNASPVGQPVEIPATLCRALQEAQAWSRETDRAFDPGIGHLLAAWAAREGWRLPTPQERESAMAAGGSNGVRLDCGARVATRLLDVRLEEGGFGKGEALDRVAAEARKDDRVSAWSVDLGGQLAARGGPPGESSWTVRIAHPERRDTALFDVQLSSGSLATSGGSERDGAVGGVRLSHILDPRSGLASAFTGSVVVWHERALVADILSTALHVMGERDGIAFADARGLAVAYLVPNGAAGVRVLSSLRFSTRFPGVS